MSIVRRELSLALIAAGVTIGACGSRAEEAAGRASGYVEATDVRVAPQVGCSRSPSPKEIAWRRVR
jgi:hypothetical protein